MNTDGPAVAYAKARVEYWNRRDWWGLEASAFDAHRAVVAALAPLSPLRLMPYEDPTRFRRFLHNWIVIWPILVVFAFFVHIYPDWAGLRRESGISPLQLGARTPGFTPSRPLDVVVWPFALAMCLAAAAVIFEVYRSWRSGGPLWRMNAEGPRGAGGRAVWGVILGFYLAATVAQCAVVVRLVNSGALELRWGYTVFALPIVIGVLAAIYFLGPATIFRPLRRVHRALARLPSGALGQVSRDLSEAITFLHARGVIDDVEARLARAAPPGDLGMTMNPTPGRLPRRRRPPLMTYLVSLEMAGGPWGSTDWWELEIAALTLGGASPSPKIEPEFVPEAESLARHLASRAPVETRVWLPGGRAASSDVSDGARRAIVARRNAAIDVLVTRGVLTGAQASLARRAPAGQMALTVAAGEETALSAERRDGETRVARWRGLVPGTWECACGFVAGEPVSDLCDACRARVLDRWCELETRLLEGLAPTYRMRIEDVLTAYQQGGADERRARARAARGLRRVYQDLRRHTPEIDGAGVGDARLFGVELLTRWDDWRHLGELAGKNWGAASDLDRTGPGTAHFTALATRG